VEYLYGDHKHKDRKIKELRKSFDKEILPFHPKINSNIHVSTSFSERNNKLLVTKNMNIMKQKESGSVSKYNPLEREEIMKKVVERLYCPKEIEKVMNKQTSTKYDYKADLRSKTHKLDREIRVSKMSTVGTLSQYNYPANKISNASNHFTKASLQSYNVTNEEVTDERETLVNTENENEDRIVKTESYAQRKNNEMSVKNSSAFIRENYQVESY